MYHRGHFSAEERQVRSQLAKMLWQNRVIRAGIVKMTRQCGKSNCRCAQGKRHVSYYLSMRVGQKRKMVYIPSGMEHRVKQWVASYKQINKAIDQLSQYSLQHLKDG